MARRPLEGITVLELGHSVAAPYAGLILADLGARVIKVENPGRGDYARGWGPPFWNGGATPFLCFNRGKQSITVDFGRADQMERLKTIILDEADAVIQNLRPGILDRFGLTAERLREAKPSLIWCDIGAFGARGPLASKPGYDPLAQATSGIMSVTGEAGRPPVRVGVSMVDMGSGMWTVIGLLSSLLSRAQTGAGCTVSTSLFETGLAWMTVPLAGHAAGGQMRKPYGSGIEEIVPYQAFHVSDGWLMVAAGNDNLFRKLCAAIGVPQLADDPDYATNAARVVHREPLIAKLGAAFAHYTSDDLSALLDRAGVPNAPLLVTDQVFRHPQTKAVGMIAPSEDDALELVGIPLTFDGERPRNFHRAPRLGEHDGRWMAARHGGDDDHEP